MKLPFNEHIKNGYHIRTFSKDVNDKELVWHRDREDRIVESVGNTDWMIQMDNELPKPLTEKVFIPKETYHRVIKGSGNLTVKIKKLRESDWDWADNVPIGFPDVWTEEFLLEYLESMGELKFWYDGNGILYEIRLNPYRRDKNEEIVILWEDPHFDKMTQVVTIEETVFQLNIGEWEPTH